MAIDIACHRMTSQGLHTYHHGFTPRKSFTTTLEAKNCGCQRKYNQWRNTYLKRYGIKMLTMHHHGFTHRISLAMRKAADKGTRLNGCCLFLLAVFLPKRKCIAANCYCPSYNNRLWKSIKSCTDHSTCTLFGIT